MVNENILSYLREGVRRGFTVDILKNKLLEGGFNERDINEAIRYLYQPNSEPQNVPLVMRNANEMMGNRGGSDLWIKIAGIVGLIISIYVLFMFVISFIPDINTEVTKLLSSESISITLGVLSLIMFFLYYFGWFRVGKKGDSSLTKYSALGIIVIMVLIIIIVMSIYLMIKPTLEDPTKLISMGTNPDLDSFISGAAKILLYVMIFLFEIYCITEILLSIGMITIRNKVKFGIVGGIFGILIFSLLFFVFNYLIYLILYNPMQLIGVFFMLMDKTQMMMFIVTFYSFIILTYFFQSLSLLSASKRF